MNQRYRNDDDFGRRASEDELEYRYAQPTADARFERDRNPRNPSRYRDDSGSFDAERNNNGWNNYGPSDYGPSRNSGASNSRGSGHFASDSDRFAASGRGGWDDSSRTSGQWQGSRGTFGGIGRDDFRSNQDRPFSSRFSGDQDYSNGYRDYGSNRDYSRAAAGAFLDENPFGVRARPIDARDPFQAGNRSNDYNGRQAAGFYADGAAQQRRGEHFGKGPKGYQRSDERIREDVCDRLAQDDALDARNITVTTSKGEVTLEGSVPDRFSKHRAEDIVDSISGVTDINNRLKVEKGFLDDISDRITGNQNHSGHAGERPTENKNGHSSLNR